MVSELCAAATVKVSKAEMVTGTTSDWAKPPSLTLSVRLYLPGAVLTAVPMFRTVEDPAVSEDDVARAVTPFGAPVTESASGPLKAPCTEPQDRATAADCPAVTFTAVGFAAKVQLAGLGITSGIASVSVNELPLAVSETW
jgi:hypothetical protein